MKKRIILYRNTFTQKILSNLSCARHCSVSWGHSKTRPPAFMKLNSTQWESNSKKILKYSNTHNISNGYKCYEKTDDRCNEKPLFSEGIFDKVTFEQKSKEVRE